MPDLHFYNTLTHQVERFESIEPHRILMYNCGPTVYDFAHIGNFKTFLFADVLRRFLELVGYDVQQVMNLTDVGHMTEDQLADGGGEDKMQLAARRLKDAKKQGDAHADVIDNPDDPYKIANYYVQAFIDDARKLGLKVVDDDPSHLPRATDYVEHMKRMIEQLVASDHAYVAEDGAVYFHVESFPDYGKLSGNTLEHLRGGAGGRLDDQHQQGKRHPADFLLWKPDRAHLMKWDSPWGAGYPGWHIECSAMARAVLGHDTIDIHTGGEDNIFPHHECEIAQSCGATGQPSFARFWMHTRHLMVEGEKMSKSKGNFYTVRQVLQGDVTSRPVDPAVLRYEMIKAKYRSTMNFTRQGLEDSAANVRKIREADQHLGQHIAAVDGSHPAVASFIAALGDDLNMAGALGEVFAFIHGPHPDPAQSRGVLAQFDRVLGVLSQQAPEQDRSADALCQKLDAARQAKDFAQADALRSQLIELGYDVKTTAQGTVATLRLA